MAFAHSALTPYGPYNKEDSVQRLERENKTQQEKIAYLEQQNAILNERLLEETNDIVYCGKAIDRLNAKLSSETEVEDPYQLKQHLADFIHDCRMELIVCDTHGDAIKNLAKDIRVVEKMFNNVTSTNVNLEELAQDYKKLERRANKREHERAEERATSRNLDKLAVAFVVFGVGMVIAGLACHIYPLALVGALAFLLGVRYGAASNEKSDENTLCGLPRSMYFFGDAAKDKAENVKKPGFWESRRRSLR